MQNIISLMLENSEALVSGIVGALVFFGVIIEAIPFIPVNPLKWLGSKLNQDIKNDLDVMRQEIISLDSRLDKIEEANLKKDLETKRSIVLNFADKIRRTDRDKLGIDQCTLEDFNFIIDVMDEYAETIRRHNIENGKFDYAREFILDTFSWLTREGRFVNTNIQDDNRY